MICCVGARFDQGVEQSRFASIGVAYQGNIERVAAIALSSLSRTLLFNFRQAIFGSLDGVIDHARGDGAVWAAGLHASHNNVKIRDRMLELGAITRAINADTNTFCPPLVITDSQLDKLLDAFAKAASGK